MQERLQLVGLQDKLFILHIPYILWNTNILYNTDQVPKFFFIYISYAEELKVMLYSICYKYYTLHQENNNSGYNL